MSFRSPQLCRPTEKILIVSVLSLTMFGLCLLPSPAEPPSLSLAEQIATLKHSEQRWLEVDLAHQRLIAWQGKTPIYAVIVSTGKSQTPTPTGLFTIQRKLREDRMRGADYDRPNVPYVMYFHHGYAIHGADWHHRFGTPVSHGCINVAVDHAQWLFEWTDLGVSVLIHP
ncbi:L,D-transpeptidase [Synechocystis sp. LKSZ1]|uniref:L,D-transpeptidase n=1 Tax=Synechocystis sp. LKSZ1 TaxID=3144951 RepID=UPI00336BCFB3